MEIEGLPKRKTAQSFVGAWERAKELGIDAAGLTGPLVAKAVAEREAELDKAEATAKAKAKAKGSAQDGEGAASGTGPNAEPAKAKKPALPALIDLKVEHLKRIAEFLVIPVADARKKDSLCEAIGKSDAWLKCDQEKIVEATAQA
jgi:hypothetical protein